MATPRVCGRRPFHRFLPALPIWTSPASTLPTCPAHLGRREPQRGEVAFLGHELHGGAGAAGELAARARLELDVVHGRADRDVPQRQGVARADLRALAAAEQIADDDTGRGEDVALLAVEVVQQRDTGVAVRVVLDGGDLRRHAVLPALEVDLPVLLLVPTAAVARRHAAVHVATRRPLLRLRERLLGLPLADLGEVGDGLEPAPRAGRLALANGHRQLPKISMESPAASETIARR
jgi:hypothetical protein